MILENRIARKLYIKLWEQKNNLESKIEDLKYKIRNLEASLEETTLELDSIGKVICMNCHGQGKGWVSYAQDDTKMERCKNCKGTGLKQNET